MSIFLRDVTHAVVISPIELQPLRRSAQVLALQQTSMPSLRPGRRLLQMRYAPINPSDLIDSRPIRAPHRPAAGAWL